MSIEDELREGQQSSAILTDTTVPARRHPLWQLFGEGPMREHDVDTLVDYPSQSVTGDVGPHAEGCLEDDRGRELQAFRHQLDRAPFCCGPGPPFYERCCLAFDEGVVRRDGGPGEGGLYRAPVRLPVFIVEGEKSPTHDQFELFVEHATLIVRTVLDEHAVNRGGAGGEREDVGAHADA